MLLPGLPTDAQRSCRPHRSGSAHCRLLQCPIPALQALHSLCGVALRKSAFSRFFILIYSFLLQLSKSVIVAAAGTKTQKKPPEQTLRRHSFTTFASSYKDQRNRSDRLRSGHLPANPTVDRPHRATFAGRLHPQWKRRRPRSHPLPADCRQLRIRCIPRSRWSARCCPG